MVVIVSPLGLVTLTGELRGSIPLQATKIKIMTRYEQEFYRNIERIAKALETLVKLYSGK